MVFRRDWLKQNGVAPAAAFLATLSSESMVSTISPGDLLLIDTSDKPPISRTSRKVAFDRKFKRPICAFFEGEGEGEGEGDAGKASNR